MANISRYTQVSELIDEMFKHIVSRPMRFLEEESGMQIRSDIAEDETTFTIKAEIPGVKKEDIQVSIDGNRVTISAESKQESEEKAGAKVIRKERYYGKVFRSMTLDCDVDQDAADAQYADGVLTLILPKKASAMTRKLTIK